ncbi:MAG: hypothetical protein LBK13_11095 [Spirochaetales bacterium]|jgi:hypothetical protein|nr:hypothetical protein [Spirochaetales bacterium]
MKKLKLLKYFTAILILAGCQSQSRYVTIFPISPGVFQYYLTPTEWETDNGDIEVSVDITYRNTPGNSAICNISLVNTARQPRSVSSAFFSSGAADYPLENIGRLFSELENSKLRITSTLPGLSLEELFASDSITLTIVLDGIAYLCTPPELFIEYKNQVLDDINIK